MVVAIVNDASSKCRNAVAEALRVLLRRVSAGVFKVLRGFILQWYNTPSAPVMQRAAAQLTGLALEVRKAGIVKDGDVGEFTEAMQEVLAAAVRSQQAPDTAGADYSDDEDDEEAYNGGAGGGAEQGKQWAPAYHTLVTAEKLMKAAPEVLTMMDNGGAKGGGGASGGEGGAAAMFFDVSLLLLHRHSWVRTAASRLLGQHLSVVDKDTLKIKGGAKGGGGRGDGGAMPGTFLERPGELFQLQRRLCEQLESEFLKDDVAEQVIKNLLFTCDVMARHPALAFSKPEGAVAGTRWANDEE